MNNKIVLAISSILSLIVLSSLASAGLTITPLDSTNLNSLKGVTIPISFNLTASTDYSSLTWNNTITSGASFSTSTSLPSSLSAGTTTISGTITIPSSFSGSKDVKLNLDVRNGTDASTANTKQYTINLYSLNIQVSQSLTRSANATVTISNTGSLPLNSINLSLSNSKVALNDASLFNLNVGASKQLIAYFTTVPSDLDSSTIILTAKDINNATDTQTIGGIAPKFCKAGNVGNLSIKNFDVTNKGEGEDDKWNPLDEIEIEVEVKNEGDSSISRVYVDIAILDSTGKDVTDDFNIDDDSIDLGRIKDRDAETAIFTIKDLPSDLDEEDYKLFVKAYKDGSESSNCADTSSDMNKNNYHLISVEKAFDRGVAVKKSELEQIQASCGDTVDFKFNVYNVGSDKEESVLVLIENPALGLKQYRVISDLRADEKEEAAFNFAVPKNLTKTEYPIYISTFFEYDGDGDIYDEDSYDSSSFDDMDENYEARLKILQCASQETAKSAISASLKSSAKVGEDMVVEATVSNIGTEAKDFVITASDYESWAKLVSIEPQVANIPAGASKVVTIKFNPTKSGTQTFNIKSIADGKTTTQLVQTTISEKTGFLTGSFLGAGSSTLMYVIIAALVIIILVILIVIIRIASSPKSKNTSSDF
jgi:hypothetical protein